MEGEREWRAQPLFHFHAFLSYSRLKLKHIQTSHRDCGDGPGQRSPEIMASAWLGGGGCCGGCLTHVGRRKHRLKASSLLIGDCSHGVVYVCTKAEPSEQKKTNSAIPRNTSAELRAAWIKTTLSLFLINKTEKTENHVCFSDSDGPVLLMTTIRARKNPTD